MRKILFLVIMLFVVAYAKAVPASPIFFDVTQPDGTVITLRMVGDEYYHWLETSDNQVVLLSDEGYYEYATILNNQVVPSGIRVSTSTKQLELQANEGFSIGLHQLL